MLAQKKSGFTGTYTYTPTWRGGAIKDGIYIPYADRCRYIQVYSRPSLSGHSQQRPPSLIGSQLNLCRYYYHWIYISSPKVTSLMWPQFLGKKGGLIREGLLYSHSNLLPGGLYNTHSQDTHHAQVQMLYTVY